MDTLKVLELLVAHGDYHSDLSKWRSKLIETHLPKLFQLARFRDLLEHEPWNEALELCKKAVQHGHATPTATTGDTAFSECLDCEMVWLEGRFKRSLGCPACSSSNSITKQAKWSWG